MALRKRMPRGIRSIYRMAHSVWDRPRRSPDIPSRQFAGAMMMGSRVDLIASLPKAGRVLEVGTDRGAFARVILERTSPGRLDVLDMDFSRFDETLRADDRVACHEGLSRNILPRFPAAAFDWIYVDGSHRYEDVVDDIAACRRIVKPGGYLVFNDFAHIDPLLGRYGVHNAVAEFLVESGWMIHAMSYEGFGLYDIAVRASEEGAS
jgi:SAM-dependent methyltransferase